MLVKSFARIHRANLINAGILPLTFKNEADYDKISLGDELKIDGLAEKIKNSEDIVIENKTNGEKIECSCELTDRTRDIILAGGLLNYTKLKG